MNLVKFIAVLILVTPPVIIGYYAYLALGAVTGGL